MKTYVLGAGASRHVGYPLMAQFGASLLDWLDRNKDLDQVTHDDWMNLNQLYQMYGGLTDIERILTDLVECPADSPVARLQPIISAQIRSSVRHSIHGCFSDLAPSDAPLYRKLVCERVVSGDALITFNYDIGLERELKKVELWEVGDGYGFQIDGLPTGKVKALKLHGSVNWSGTIFGGNLGFGCGGESNALGTRPVIFFQREFEALGYPVGTIDPECAGISASGLEFCLILPILSKKFYFQTRYGREWEHFFHALWRQAYEALRASDEVVIIGYSLPAADMHARKLLFDGISRDARIVICSGVDSDRLCEMFRCQGFRRIASVPSGLFEQYLDCGEF
jgi:hypothetical protein